MSTPNMPPVMNNVPGGSSTPPNVSIPPSSLSGATAINSWPSNDTFYSGYPSHPGYPHLPPNRPLSNPHYMGNQFYPSGPHPYMPFPSQQHIRSPSHYNYPSVAQMPPSQYNPEHVSRPPSTDSSAGVAINPVKNSSQTSSPSYSGGDMNMYQNGSTSNSNGVPKHHQKDADNSQNFNGYHSGGNQQIHLGSLPEGALDETSQHSTLSQGSETASIADRSTTPISNLKSAPMKMASPGGKHTSDSLVHQPVKASESLGRLYDLDDDPERKPFLDRLIKFMEERKTPLTQSPVVARVLVDLYKLYVMIKERGGYQEASKTRAFKEICVLLEIGTSANSCYTLKKHYSKIVLPYECHYDRGGVDPAVVLQQVDALTTPRGKGKKNASGAGGSASLNSSNASSPGGHGGGGSIPTGGAGGLTSASGGPPSSPLSSNQDHDSRDSMSSLSSNTITGYESSRTPNNTSSHPPQQRSVSDSKGVGVNGEVPPFQNDQTHLPWGPSKVEIEDRRRHTPSPNVTSSSAGLNKPPSLPDQPLPPPNHQFNNHSGGGMPPNFGRGGPNEHPIFVNGPPPDDGSSVIGMKSAPPPPYSSSHGPQGIPPRQATTAAPPYYNPNPAAAKHHQSNINNIHPTVGGSEDPYQPRFPHLQPSSMPNGGRPPSHPTSDQVHRPLVVNGAPPTPNVMLVPQSHHQSIPSQFPDGCVESSKVSHHLNVRKAPRLPKHLYYPVDGWRLIMALKSGLLAETTWALDTLALLLFDDNAIAYFGLGNMPGLLVCLLDHWRSSLASVFKEFDDFICKANSQNEMVTKNNSSRHVKEDVGIIKDSSVTILIHEKDATNNFNLHPRFSSTMHPSRLNSLGGVTSTASANNSDSNTENSNHNAVHQMKIVSKENNEYAKEGEELRTGVEIRVCQDENDVSCTPYLKCDVSRLTGQRNTIIDDDESYFNDENDQSSTDWLSSHAISKGCGGDTDYIVQHSSAPSSDRRILKRPHARRNTHTSPSDDNVVEFSDGVFTYKLPSSVWKRRCLSRSTNCSSEQSQSGPLVKKMRRRVIDSDGHLLPTTDSKYHHDPSSSSGYTCEYDEFVMPDDSRLVAPPTNVHESCIRKAVLLSTIFRNLSVVPGNEIDISQNTVFLSLVGRLLLYNIQPRLTPLPSSNSSSSDAKDDQPDRLTHSSPFSESPETNFDSGDQIEEAEDSSTSDSAINYDDDLFHWSWPYLHVIRENILVTISNISGHLDLSNIDSSIARPLLSGILEFAVSSASYAQDSFHPSSSSSSSTSSSILSPQRLAIESLCKLCLFESNVYLILSTPPYQRLVSLTQQLSRRLNRECDSTYVSNNVIREMVVNIFYYWSSLNLGLSRTICHAEKSTVSLLISFIEQAEQNALLIAQQRGVNVLRDNPDAMGTSLDMLRRTASTLRYLSLHPDNVPILSRYESRFLSLVMSQILDQGVASILSNVLFNISKYTPPPSESQSSLTRRLSSVTAMVTKNNSAIKNNCNDTMCVVKKEEENSEASLMNPSDQQGCHDNTITIYADKKSESGSNNEIKREEQDEISNSRDSSDRLSPVNFKKPSHSFTNGSRSSTTEGSGHPLIPPPKENEDATSNSKDINQRVNNNNDSTSTEDPEGHTDIIGSATTVNKLNHVVVCESRPRNGGSESTECSSSIGSETVSTSSTNGSKIQVST